MEKTSVDTVEPELTMDRNTESVTRQRVFMLLVGGMVLPLLAFSLVQYFRYGFGLFLGWDTSTYVWWAEQVHVNGPLFLVLQGYPHLYVLGIAGLGDLLGSTSAAERILPFFAAVPLGYAYYRLTFHIGGDRKLGYLAAVLGGTTVNTLRLFSDLHRNLLSFSISMLVGALISSELSSKPFSWGPRKKRALLLWLPLLTIEAYTQIETYVVLALTLSLLFYTTGSLRTTLVGIGLLATPVIVVLPLTWSFLFNYQAGLSLLGIPLAYPVIVGEGALFLGGLGLPLVVLGLVFTVRRARLGNPAAGFIALWMASIAVLFPIGLALGLPVSRLFYIVPVPVATALSIPPSIWHTPRLRRILSLKTLRVLLGRNGARRYALPWAALTVVVIATIFTSVSTTDLFLRPYVSSTDVGRLLEAAEIAKASGYDRPILVMYGATAADVNPIYRAYFGIEIPNSLAYYGKLQYVFSLPYPKGVYNWQYNPPFEMASSLKYRSEILSQLGASTAVSGLAIVIAGGRTYDRPLSESFISRFERAPGIYLVPPGALMPEELDSWRLFAYSDWTNTTSFVKVNVAWSHSPIILTWVDKGPKSRFDANFTTSLAHSWSVMQLTLRFYDWPQPYTFPDSSTVMLAPLDIYFDGQLVLSYGYAGSGQPIIVRGNLSDISSGVHQVRIRSESFGLGVAVALDEVKLCPMQCPSLSTGN